MADNTELNSGTGGDTIATDDVVGGVAAGAKVQRVKAGFGADNSYADPTGGAGAVDAGTARVTVATDQAAILVDGSAVQASVQTEDAASSGGETGSMTLGVRHDADTSPVSADGDFHALQFDELGNLKTAETALVDAGNSSTTPLGAAATFTGTGIDAHRLGLATVLVHAEPSSADGTLFLEFSSDNVNWDRSVSIAVADGTVHPPHTVIPIAQYFRVRYLNGSTIQTVLRLQTVFGNRTKGLTSRLSQSLSAETDVDNVRAVIVGDSGGGTFVNVGVTASGNFKVDFEDIGGNAVSVGAGNVDTGTQRVVLATDQAAVAVDPSAVTSPVSVASLPLPTGAATAAAQLADGHNVTVDNASLVVDGSAVTQPVSASSLPLPTGAASAALQLTDNHGVTANAGTGDFLSVAAHTRNEGFKESNAIGGELDDTAPVLATEGNVSPLRITPERSVHSELRSGTAETGVVANPLVVTDDGSPILTDPSGVTSPVSLASVPLPTGAATLAGQLADGHNVTVDNASLVVDGSAVTQPVSAVALPLPAGAATSALQLVDGHAVTVDNAAGATSVPAQGAAAHAATVAGNPVLAGLEARTTLPTAVTDGQAVRAMGDDKGRQIVRIAPRDRITHNTISLSSTTETTLIAALAATFRDLVQVIIHNGSGSGVQIDFRDSTGGTIRYSAFAAANGGGSGFALPVPLTQAVVNNNWTAQLASAVGPVLITAIAVDDT